jgi:hypothetical protein
MGIIKLVEKVGRVSVLITSAISLEKVMRVLERRSSIWAVGEEMNMNNSGKKKKNLSSRNCSIKITEVDG